MSWSVVTSGQNESWSDVTHAATSWTDGTTSNTTTRNTSRFILYNPSAGSVRGGVDFAIHVRSTDEKGRGAGWLVTTNDPVLLHSSGDSTV